MPWYLVAPLSDASPGTPSRNVCQRFQTLGEVTNCNVLLQPAFGAIPGNGFGETLLKRDEGFPIGEPAYRMVPAAPVGMADLTYFAAGQHRTATGQGPADFVECANGLEQRLGNADQPWRGGKECVSTV